MSQLVKNFADELISAIRRKKSYVVVGIDPRFELLPKEFRKYEPAAAFYKFNKAVIDVVSSYVVAVKPQVAFYEMWGSRGFRTFELTCEYAKSKGLLVIADVKRGDVPETAKAYAKAYCKVDAVTVNPFFGADGIAPFIDCASINGGGIFVLVKTSNPSSKELQDLKVGKKRLYEILADNVRKWSKGLIGKSGYSSVGAVVGATYPEQAKSIRSILKKSFLLIPGYGAQGGKAGDLKAYFNEDGLGALVSASRSIIFAYKDDAKRGWKEAIEMSARIMRDEINEVIWA